MRLYTIRNGTGVKIKITNYGGRIVELFTPDRYGHFTDIVLGYDIHDKYLTSSEKYYGAIIGRYGNRIGKSKFSIGTRTYQLAMNDGKNNLHGGNYGFSQVYWDVNQLDDKTLELKYFSEDMEEGFPGNLNVKVVYSLTDSNELKIEYFATTDKTTIVNLTHHSFFNLTGNAEKTIYNHILQIPADFYTPVNEELIPTGEFAPVEDTPFDFRVPIPIGERIEETHEQLKFGKGYDHNWVLNEKRSKIHLAAKVADPLSGRTMDVFTNEPGIQFYSGNFLNGKDVGKGNVLYNHRTAFCLETQHFPDSPNKKAFPSTVLLPGDEYYSICIYRFDVI